MTIYLTVVLVEGTYYATRRSNRPDDPKDPIMRGFVFQVQASGGPFENVLDEVHKLAKAEARKRGIPFVVHLDENA